MILRLKKIRKIVKPANKTVSALLLTATALSSIYASDYDFNKLATLASERYGAETRQDVAELNQLVQKLHSASEPEKLKQVNDFFNHKISFTDDFLLWGQSDYWATPLESLGRQAGDCEDFSIAKYAFLKMLNVDNNRMRLTYVKAQILHDGSQSLQAHMVLSYYETPQSEPLILDNLIPEILPASSRKDLSPIFSFNDKGLWVGSSNKPKGEAQSNLSRWRDVLSRIRADGIK